MRKKKFNAPAALQYFYDLVFKHVLELGRRPIIWQEAFDQGVKLPKGGVVQPWQCWGDIGGPHVQGWLRGEPPATLGHFTAYAAAAQGFGAVQSTCWYLDWDSQWSDFYEHAADEGPVRWADVESIRDQLPGTGLLGGEAALWTEKIDFTNLCCRMWPRAAAVAERLWSNTAPGLLQRGTFEQKVLPRMSWHTYRMQRLYGVYVRPLFSSSEKQEDLASQAYERWLSDDRRLQMEEFADTGRVCPLLESQAIQRDPTSEDITMLFPTFWDRDGDYAD
jgi:hypothetical protein